MMGRREKGLTLLEIVIVMGALCFIMAMMFVLREGVDNTAAPSSASRDVAQPVEVERASQDHF